jgi:hypothetical protein
VAVHNYDVVYKKGNVGALCKCSEFRVDMGEGISIKTCPNQEQQ